MAAAGAEAMRLLGEAERRLLGKKKGDAQAPHGSGEQLK